jgi:hypothetical protein
VVQAGAARSALDAGIKTAFFLYTLPLCFPACFPLPASMLNFYVKLKYGALNRLSLGAFA